MRSREYCAALRADKEHRLAVQGVETKRTARRLGSNAKLELTQQTC